MFELAYFALLAFILGFKHSYDADHIIAVSNILRKSPSAGSAAKISISWAVGHMITAAIITIIIFILKDSLLKPVLEYFEVIAGIMLVALGCISLKDSFALHSHIHTHSGVTHSHPHLHLRDESRHAHRHMFGIGIIHGLASNDELLILLTASLGITSIGGILAGIGIFSIGVVLGMILFACLFSYSILKLRTARLYRLFLFGTGAISVAYGIGMLFPMVFGMVLR